LPRLLPSQFEGFQAEPAARQPGHVRAARARGTAICRRAGGLRAQ